MNDFLINFVFLILWIFFLYAEIKWNKENRFHKVKIAANGIAVGIMFMATLLFLFKWIGS